MPAISSTQWHIRSLPLQRLSQWVTDSAERERHQRANGAIGSSSDAQLLQSELSPEPYRMPDLPLPLVQAPTLMIFGSNDPTCWSMHSMAPGIGSLAN